MNKYICTECGTRYQTESNEVPPSIKWSDGHRCNLKKIKSEEKVNS